MRPVSYWWASPVAGQMEALERIWVVIELTCKKRLLEALAYSSDPGPIPAVLTIPIVSTGEVQRFVIPEHARRLRAEQDRHRRRKRASR